MPNVSIRFSTQDAEVVRTALDKLGKDGEAALKRIDAAQSKAGAETKGLSTFIDDLRGKFIGLAVPLGPVGSGLIALGPAGTVAAVGIGAVIAAIDKMNTAANALADKSFGIKNFADAVGLTTDQVQAIIDVSAKFGVAPEAAQSFVEKFTVEMDQLRKGSGNLYDQIMRIDSGLAAQLAGAKSTADAWNLVAKAYKDADAAGDVFRRNTIARAIGGARGAIGAGAVLSATADAGGLSSLTNDVRQAGGMIDSELIAKLAKLRTEIKQTGDDANTVFASIFSEQVLANQLRFAETWLEIAKAAKEFSLSPSLSKFFEFFSRSVAAGQSDDAKSILASGEQYKRDQALARATADIEKLTAKRDNLSAAIVNATDARVVSNLAGELERVNEQIRIREKLLAGARPQVVINKPGEDVPLPQARPTPPAATGPVSAEFVLQQMRTWTAVLGSAITPTEQLRLKIAELNAVQEKGGVSDQVRARSLGAFLLAQGATNLATRERLGVASQEEIVTQRLKELEDLRAKGFITNAADMARAEQVIQREAKASAEAMQVRASALPGLKQFELDATNLNKALDTTATQGVNDLTTAVNNLAMGNKKAGQSATEFGLSVVSSISAMIIKMQVAAPIAKALQSIFSAFLPGVGSTGPALGGGIWPAAKGAAFSEFANGGTFTNGLFSQPTFFRFANGGTPGLGVMGEAGPEAVVPLQRGRDGRLGISAYGGGGIGTGDIQVPVRVTIEGAPADKKSTVQARRGSDGGLDLLIAFKDQVAEDISSGGPIARSIEGQYGLNRVASAY